MDKTHTLGIIFSIILMIIPPFFIGVLLLLFVLGHNYMKNVESNNIMNDEQSRPDIKKQFEDESFKKLQEVYQ